MNDLGLLLSQSPCVNYLSFIELMKVAVANMWDKKVAFAAAYPDDKVDVTPIITHKIETKEPGSVNNHGSKEIKPRQRYSGKTDDGKQFRVLGQWFDYRIRFDIWGSTGEEADRTVLEFESLMSQYVGFFKRKGVSEFLFEKQINDSMTKVWRAELTNRTLIYYLRLDETKIVIDGEMKTFDINAFVLDALHKEPGDHMHAILEHVPREDNDE